MYMAYIKQLYHTFVYHPHLPFSELSQNRAAKLHCPQRLWMQDCYNNACTAASSIWGYWSKSKYLWHTHKPNIFSISFYARQYIIYPFSFLIYSLLKALCHFLCLALSSSMHMCDTLKDSCHDRLQQQQCVLKRDALSPAAKRFSSAVATCIFKPLSPCHPH